MTKLHWETVTPLLKDGLQQLMAEPVFNPFRLVGGTSLSLQCGHRLSVDIDLFTDAAYGSINFGNIDALLRKLYAYVSPGKLPEQTAMGTSYIVGEDKVNAFKLDLYYTDNFIDPYQAVQHIRLATIPEIIAMKMDIIQRGGRKKDFWDLHLLLGQYTVEEMIHLHERRYPYTHEEATIRKNLADFTNADDDLDPVCLLGKQWQLIKLDFVEAVNNR